ncbi:MAG: hypothetical protein SVW57_03705 [Thermodesulfobacteriota bacterium]|nr:hypothetical protein [Thermodesulfobacteriota bacterium]
MEDEIFQNELPKSDEWENQPFHTISVRPRKVFPKRIIVIPAIIIVIFILSYYFTVRFGVTIHVNEVKEKFVQYFSGLTSTKGTMDFITFTDVGEEFKRNAHLGNILVITGKVLNNGINPISFVKLRGQTFNEKGDIIEEQWVYCGNTLSDEELIELKPSEILNTLKSKNENEMNSCEIPPKSSNLFTLVFTKVIKEIDVYVIEPLGFE